jgi:hypothetical protein
LQPLSCFLRERDAQHAASHAEQKVDCPR